MTNGNRFEPNPAQAEAINGCGIQLVLAGPGSGKTRVITEKILHMIRDDGAKPEEILALTFSDKAAAEMAERLEKETDISRLTIATFHSFCLEVLEDNVLDTGISFNSGLISRTSQLVWGMKNIDNFGFGAVEIGNNGPSVIESIIDGISRFRDELISAEDIEEYLEGKKEQELSADEEIYLAKLSDLLKVYREYENYKRREGLLDFDDMIHETVRLFRSKPDIRRQYGNRFRYILVDEFQDTNYAQLELVKLLASDNLCIVGDDDQSIYRFRGACDGNVDEFSGHFEDHKKVVLEENYRNPGKILRVARRLMECADGSCTKNLKAKSGEGDQVIVAECSTENTEAGYVADEIESLMGEGFLPGEIAILCRKRSEGGKYREVLAGRNIPCDFTGDAAFFTIPVIKDAVSYLKAIANPGESGIPLNRMMRQAGVSETAILEINTGAKQIRREGGKGDCVLEAMKKCGPENDPDTIVIREIAENVEQLSSARHKKTLPALVREIILRTGRLYSKDREGVAALNSLYEIALEFSRINPAGEIDDLLDHLSLLRDISGDFELSEGGGAGVRIMTVHQSKGKEFSAVFVTDLSERRFPLNYRSKPFHVPTDLSKSIKAGEDEKELYRQEERRLLYVAMTRAKEKLYLTRAIRYGENKRDSKPSEFLNEIDYLNNPDIMVVSIEGGNQERGVVIATEEGDPFSEENKLMKEAVAAIADKRYRSAVQKILALEYIRNLDDGKEFDNRAFLDIPFEVPEGSRRKPEPLIIPGDGTILSASALKLYEDCPLRFKFKNILKIPTEPKTYLSLGTTAHSIIERLTKMKMEGTCPTMEKAEDLLERSWSPDAYSSRKHEEEDKKRLICHLANYLEWEANNPNTPLETEFEFEIPVCGTPFKGYIDRLERTESGGYAVVDYKTSKTPMSKNDAKKDIQLNLYALCVKDKTGILPEKVSLFYLGSGKMVDYVPDYESISAFLENAESIIDRIFAGDFEPNDSHNCSNCDYRILCGE
ncbi:ATP-dependent helicase [Methanolacinia paynteri]|uniref:ATP-dependent helicase n=1 Tax=Methanolacinia paynteri TaxID=230356 RepID=UPI00064F78B9|nr:ATP-dependent DNA helicase [Methanolacinia paynteri]